MRLRTVQNSSSYTITLMLATSLTFACTSEKPDGSSDDSGIDSLYVDNDGDGQSEAEGDCDDSNSDVYLGADEFCDGIDNNCSGAEEGIVDETDAIDVSNWYQDQDGDGYGNAAQKVKDCTQPTGYVDNTNDCNDNEPLAWFGNAEVCDGVDNDCSGDIDGDAPNQQTWYLDNDGDGYGIPYVTTEACFQPDGYADNTDDCNDAEPLAWTGNPEVCDGVDNNCLAGEADATDTSIWYTDADGDGYGDPNSSVESCDPDLAPICFDVVMVDTWGDGWNGGALSISIDGNAVDSGQPDGSPSYCESCTEQTEGTFYVPSGSIFTVENAFCLSSGQSLELSYRSDSYDFENLFMIQSDRGVVLYSGSGVESSGVIHTRLYEGLYSDNTDDCDDTEPLAWTDNTEVCDGVDNNCIDGENDASDKSTWYFDWDGDGYGDPSVQAESCSAPVFYVDNADDCNDSEYLAYTGATEVCDGVDNNCIDGENDAPSQSTWYLDSDQDSYGDPTQMVVSCDPDYLSYCFDVILDDSFGDDWNGGYLNIYIDGQMVHSGLPETNASTCFNCPPQPEGSFFNTGSSNSETYASAFCVTEGELITAEYTGGNYDSENSYSIVSSDGYNTLVTESGTTDGLVYGEYFVGYYVDNSDDCDDTESLAYTGADELCDGVDNDCDGDIDDDALNTREWYYDWDNDGYGNSSITIDSCFLPFGYAENGDDCDDYNSNITNIAQWYFDFDLDGFGDANTSIESCVQPTGYVLDGSDCNDLNSSINSAAAEVCDGIDNDCDGLLDDADASLDLTTTQTFYSDLDSDGYGNPNDPIEACLEPSGYILDSSDCNDNADDTYPGAAFNEAPPLDIECLTDADGDGYAEPLTYSCFTLEMQDSWGDGWNGGALTIYADGVMVDSGLPADSQSQLAGTFYLDTGSAGTLSFCAEGNLLELYYDSGSFESENTYQLYDDEGNLLFEDGTSPALGLAFSYDIPFSIGSDCDDTNTNIGPTDADNDGYIDCINDCDPSDSLAGNTEFCFDGFDNDCDGFVDCDDSDCSAELACQPTTESNCSNGLDDDGDGLSDCNDSDCFGEPTCQFGPESDCSNGADDDGDGLSDCDDSDCAYEMNCAEPTCPNFDLISLDDIVLNGSNTGGVNQTNGSCHSSGAKDYSYAWVAPADGCLELDTNGSNYDTSIYILDQCNGSELACNDDSIYGLRSYLTYDVSAGEDYILVVDGYSSSSQGNFVMNMIFTSGVSCN